MKAAKRLLCMLLSLCLVLGMLPGTVLAASNNLPFTDVNTTDWFHGAVQYVYEKGMMSGTSTTTFAPGGTTTRGMIVTILHRMEGNPSASGTAFTDVPAGQWYTDAVAWASANQIVSGYGNGVFGPNDAITREQMVAILYRYSQYKNYDVSTSGNITSFSDAAQISSYAESPMSWAVSTGLISGVGNNTLAPKGNATRAQAATILMRYCENVVLYETSNTPESTYTVTFNLNYGSEDQYDVKTVKAGETVNKPSNPSRMGYSFSGWYTEKSGGKQFDFKKAITSDLTLYAHWSSNSGGGSSSGGGTSDGPITPVHYTVTFITNGGSNVAAQQVEAGGYVTRPADPILAGFAFGGWYSDNDLTIPFTFNTPISANITLYAKWSEYGNWSSPEEFFAVTSTGIIETIRADKSEDVLTEAQVVEELKTRGFGLGIDADGNPIGYPITYEYSIDGQYTEETEVSDNSIVKHPMYQTLYMSQAGDVGWVIYVINGKIFASPASFNLETDTEKELLVTEDEAGKFTSYCDGKFYVTISNGSTVYTKTVTRIDAETLDELTFDILCTMTGATRLTSTAVESGEDEFVASVSLNNVYSLAPESVISETANDDFTIVVSLGDSFSSGEGIEPFYGQNIQPLAYKVMDEDWLAHRSTKSWPSLLKIPGVEGTMPRYKVGSSTTNIWNVYWYFGAVSGAETKHFEKETQKKEFWKADSISDLHGITYLPKQLDIFDKITGSEVDYVTLTIGGNDVDFTEVITRTAIRSSYLTAVDKEKSLKHKLDELWSGIETTMESIEAVYDAIADRAPKATIIVAGYPKLLDKYGKGALINIFEAKMVNEKISAFNDEIEKLVIKCRTRTTKPIDIWFVDVEEEFSGHEAYSKDWFKDVSWINPIQIGAKREDINDQEMVSAYSMHPNEKGAQAYARCVNAKIAEIENQKNIYNKTLSGIITIADADTDMTNNFPLKGAKITLTKVGIVPLIRSGESGIDGRYQIENLASGDYVILITADGYDGVVGSITIAEDVENYYDAALKVIPEVTETKPMVTTISAGDYHSGVVDENGSLWVWGRNDRGQLGNGTKENALSPIRIMDNVQSISVGTYHTAAIQTDGSLWIWGCNHEGELGNGITGNDEGYIWDSWGGDDYPIQTVPVKIMEDVSAVSCGNEFTAIIKNDGSLWMWGRNEHGQIGNGTTEIVTAPIKIMENVVAVCAGLQHTTALQSDGTLWAWGNNDYYVETSNDALSPVKILDNVVSISEGAHNTAAIKNDGSLWMCGWISYDGLNASTSDTMIQVLPQVSSVSLGYSHYGVIMPDQSLWMWGNGDYGRLGLSNGTQSDPTKMSQSTMDDVVLVDIGRVHTIAVKSDGSVWTWGGQNINGELGNGTTNSSRLPAQISGLIAKIPNSTES